MDFFFFADNIPSVLSVIFSKSELLKTNTEKVKVDTVPIRFSDMTEPGKKNTYQHSVIVRSEKTMFVFFFRNI